MVEGVKSTTKTPFLEKMTLKSDDLKPLYENWRGINLVDSQNKGLYNVAHLFTREMISFGK